MASKPTPKQEPTRPGIPIPAEPATRRVAGCAVAIGLVLVSLVLVNLYGDYSGNANAYVPVATGALLIAGLVLLATLLISARNGPRPVPTDNTPRPASDSQTSLTTRIAAQTIEQRARFLEILYDISASISTSRDVDDLLERFLQTLQRAFDAHAATIRLTADKGEMRLLGSRGLNREVLRCEELLSVQESLWHNALEKGDIVIQEDLQPCSEILKSPSCNDQTLCVIGVPVRYHTHILGVYILFVDRDNPALGDDYRQLLGIIGRHLGIAIERARSEELASQITIMEERNHLAQELHDSLAQSLASLRFQVRVLDETLHQGNESALWQELERIENSLDEANTELRGMIANFRAPMHPQGLLPALGKLIGRFRNETKMHVFLQNEWGRITLPQELETQVLRIIQEALANIRKHSQANHVRVMLSGGGTDGYCRVLVEDDGIGMTAPSPGTPGEHIGLSIMHERANRLGGELRVESEVGEGTRLVLRFPVPAQDPDDRNHAG